MKKLLIVPALCVLLWGCGSDETSVASDTTADASEDFEVKRVGEKLYGYIDVLEDWDLYEDEALAGEAAIQYTDPDGYSVITMQYYDDTDALTSTMNLGTLLEDSVEELSSAVVELGGYKAYQLAGYATENERIMACWLFDGDDGYTHVVSIESNDEQILALCDTYALDE
ncbi:MAG: hypothetical protein LUG26_08495 [Ruminococcus sp.]|nr:hypothetical protein [Ruminococcus sp.]